MLAPELTSGDRAQLEKAHRNRTNEFMQRHCRKLLQALMDRPFGYVFNMPVDTERYPNYLEVVKRPMDFGTIRKQIDSGVYSSLGVFVADVNLVLDNARTFNAPGSHVYHMANALQVRAMHSAVWPSPCGQQIMVGAVLCNSCKLHV